MNKAGLLNSGQDSSVHSRGKPPKPSSALPRMSSGTRKLRGDVACKFVKRNCLTPLSYGQLCHGIVGYFFIFC